MLYNIKEQILYMKNMKIDYITFGTGKKTLILIQGLNTRGIKGSGLLLAYMYRVFAKDFRVYLFDRRPSIEESITVRDMASDIATAMDILGISNADIIGVSQGGMIAQYLAIDRPDLVNKLVLVVTLSRNNNTVKNVINNWIKMAQQGNIKKLIKDMTEKMYSNTYIKRYRPFFPLLTILQKPKDIKRFIILAKSCLTCNTYEILEKIKCPVFVIGGQQDKIVTGTASREIAKKLNCKIYMYDDLGHAVYEESKDFNQRIYDFLMQ